MDKKLIKLTYVTKNKAKYESMRNFFDKVNKSDKYKNVEFQIENVKMDTMEIQNDNIEMIASQSAIEASKTLGCDVIKNDTGLFIDALGGFPGPYTHYTEDKLGYEGILKLMEGQTNRDAAFIEAYAYCSNNNEPVIFKSITKGKIANAPSGIYGWGYDLIFIPEKEDKTLANFEDEKRYKLWNNDAFCQMEEYFNKRMSNR